MVHPGGYWYSIEQPGADSVEDVDKLSRDLQQQDFVRRNTVDLLRAVIEALVLLTGHWLDRHLHSMGRRRKSVQGSRVS